MSIRLIVLALLTAAGGCTSSPYLSEQLSDWMQETPPPEEDLLFRVYLIGDSGHPELDRPDPVLTWLERHYRNESENSAAVYLGDNIYPKGLPESDDPLYAQSVARIDRQLDVLKDFPGRIVWIPGNHDWDKSGESGLVALNRQEDYIESYLARGNTFLPDDGFPGPVVVNLTDGLVLVVIDTEWWLHDFERPIGDTGDYDLETEEDFLLEFDDVMRKNEGKRAIVVGHHSMYSNGEHGGFVSLKHHIFPLTAFMKDLWVPLPIIGSLYPLGRAVGISKQDLANPSYRRLRSALQKIYKEHDPVVYAAGHDHSLQYFEHEGSKYLTSGAGSKRDHVIGGHGALFTSPGLGVMTLQYYRDKSVWLEVHRINPDGTSKLALRTVLFAAPQVPFEPPAPEVYEYPDYTDSARVKAIEPRYRTNFLGRFLFGAHYRKEWATPVSVPMLDMGRFAGGLRPTGLGGGMQTISLRLRGKDGREYVLRSINKDPSKSVPPHLRDSFARDFVQDQISALHPFGPYLIPTLSEAAGVYHTNPKFVYVPDDIRLGPYRDRFAGRVMMIEVRPDDDMSDAPNFGNSKDVVSSRKMMRKVYGDNDDRVDARMFARARLLDFLMSDWDRHAGQWRWARYKLDDGTLYRPVPRDRDFAFFKFDGVLPTLSKLVIRKYVDFEDGYGRLEGLSENGRDLDRWILAELSEDDWVEIADSLKSALTDDVIDRALEAWPPEIVAIDGDTFRRRLRLRRDKLPEIARRYYKLRSKVVDVVGSNKHERFEVDRLSDGEVDVVVYKTKKEGDIRKKIFERRFFRGETQEIRLYGLDGQDRFVFSGPGRDGILIRVIGGSDPDVFSDSSGAGKGSPNNIFYDTSFENTWRLGPDSKKKTAADPAINRYNRGEYKPTFILPLLSFGANPEDGVFVGGGAAITTYGFRKRPFKAFHKIKADFAAETQAYHASYSGEFIEALGPLGIRLGAWAYTPNNIHNYYGFGNETTNTVADRNYYRTRISRYGTSFRLSKRLSSFASVSAGPEYERTELYEPDDRSFVIDPQADIDSSAFSPRDFMALASNFSVDRLDKPINPTIGVRFNLEGRYEVDLGDTETNYGKFESALSLYYTLPTMGQWTVAVRTGGEKTFGSPPFYKAATLGGRRNLRGYRGTRFAGASSFYNNVDLRIKVTDFSSYVAVGSFGLLGFYDVGRVWVEGEDSSKWHPGYGAGIWFDLFGMAALTVNYEHSSEDDLVRIKTGFQF